MRTRTSLIVIGCLAAIGFFLSVAWQSPVSIQKTDRLQPAVETSFLNERFGPPQPGQ